MQITVNADDFGMNENTTKAIAECFRRGIVNRTTAMVNMPWFENAVKIAGREGFAERVGLHVNLSEGRPLTAEMRKCRFWCNADGSFRGRLWKNKLWRFWMPREAVSLAGIEIDAQMKAFVASGLSLRHFDSHQYSCSYWPLVDVACATARRNGFTSTRGFFSAPHRQFYCNRVNKCIDRYGLSRPDALLFTKDIPRLASMVQFVSRIEIHCHPNRRNSKGAYDANGKLMDWMTDYGISLALCENLTGLGLDTDEFLCPSQRSER